MNQTHIHLLINHLPVFGSMFGILVLTYGLWNKSNTTQIAAYLIFILSSLGAGVAYLTGEAAEETVEDLPGVVEANIKTHEQFAVFALVALIVLGIAASVALVLTIKKSTWAKNTAMMVLFISLLSFGLVARTGYLGGMIRHTELNLSTNTSPVILAPRGKDND